MLLNIGSIGTFKIKINSRMALKHPKCPALFMQRLIHYKKFTLWEKPKTCSEGPHLANGHIVKVYTLLCIIVVGCKIE